MDATPTEKLKRMVDAVRTNIQRLSAILPDDAPSATDYLLPE